MSWFKRKVYYFYYKITMQNGNVEVGTYTSNKDIFDFNFIIKERIRISDYNKDIKFTFDFFQRISEDEYKAYQCATNLDLERDQKINEILK